MTPHGPEIFSKTSPTASSPAATGPAGPQFESQVAASYLLAMLAGADARGLPSFRIDCIALQQAIAGHPLDDVVVRGHNDQGVAAVLEIQVKRAVDFTPSDLVFRAAVKQIAEAASKPDFWDHRHELAIAIARTSRKIDTAYQDVLSWARQIGSADIFLARLKQSGTANADMRRFVDTFRAHLSEYGCASDDDFVWRLLRRLQILVFDFTAVGSAFLALMHERSIRVLHPDESTRANDLWIDLCDLAQSMAIAGGDRTPGQLNTEIAASFRLAGERRYAIARAALVEASAFALSDISDRIAGVTLARRAVVEAVQAALDTCRYVEIRGDGGVGKSAVLKFIAEQTAQEGHVLVLSHGRTIPRGWLALRDVLGFDGTAREFLVDLAANGSCILFIDGLDFLDREEQRTVLDLLRAAAEVPGLSIIATARTGFGIAEPSWVPNDLIRAFGVVLPVVVQELTDDEVNDLQHAAPGLAPLLTSTHPARQVVRNPFRLARLAVSTEDPAALRTEADMAQQWWRCADGGVNGQRERARLLYALAEQALAGREPLEVRAYPVTAVDALVQSESLRDLGHDRMAFRHDVLRDWAVANLLFEEPDRVSLLPLTLPIPASLERGVEIAARLLLERYPDITRWRSFLVALSASGAHGSWRRSALLALTRSERAVGVLDRAAATLTEDGARLLRELIRTILAVETQPAREIFVEFGIDPGKIPDGLHLPSGPSWYSLVLWLLARLDQLPIPAVPDIVELFSGWSMGLMGRDRLTPTILERLHSWLVQIEAERRHYFESGTPVVFRGHIDYKKMADLESALRAQFLLYSRRRPDLARQYLQRLLASDDDRIAQGILKFRGSLAEAAPTELAQLVRKVLIPAPPEDDDIACRSHRDDEPFTFVDHDFLPSSPAQGPFFELLLSEPSLALTLVRDLVNHAIAFYTRGRPPNSITLYWPDRERHFTWPSTFSWPRSANGLYCIASGLMAIEAWAHRRIDAGEVFETVLADVLGTDETPAAYLLIAVDLILSHWPKSRDAAVPFLGNPKLLALDCGRYNHDGLPDIDVFGLGPLSSREPQAQVSLKDIQSRPSRKAELSDLLGHYAFPPLDGVRDQLVERIKSARKVLGEYAPNANLTDPAFMAMHALNLLDPANYKVVTGTTSDGRDVRGHHYVPPTAEHDHLQALLEKSGRRMEDSALPTMLAVALEDPAKSTVELTHRGVRWAQREADPEDKDAQWAHEYGAVTAAALAMRDGDPALRAESEAWARTVFEAAFNDKEDGVHRIRAGTRYNLIATAAVGLIYLYAHDHDPQDRRRLLEIAASPNPAAAHGFGAALSALETADARLVASVLRCAFAAAVKTWSSPFAPKDEQAIGRAAYRAKVATAVDAEIKWLDGEWAEPGWPEFPPETSVPRRNRIHLGEALAPAPRKHTRPSAYVDHQAAAIWLRNMSGPSRTSTPDWLVQVVRVYAGWTSAANGAGLDAEEEINRKPDEWNRTYYDLLARNLAGLSPDVVTERALKPIIALPDESYYDVVALFQRSIDEIVFEQGTIDPGEAAHIREVLAQRMMDSNGWRSLVAHKSTSIEVHIAPAIAVLFFCDYDRFQPPSSYLLAKGTERLPSYLPTLSLLAETGPSLFVAILVLCLVEVAPKAEQLQFVVSAAKAWLANFSESTEFWIDHAIGRRLCRWLDKLAQLTPDRFADGDPIRTEIDALLAALVRIGVPEARQLERALPIHK